MVEFSFDKPQDLHALRVMLYASFDWDYKAKAIPPAGLALLHNSAMVHSPSGAFRCNGHIRGAGYRDLKFDIYEVEANMTDIKNNLDMALMTAFDGVLISVEHYTSFFGRCIVTRDKGVLNPKQIDDMKRIGLVDTTFEDKFEVYADDQVEGRALLTPDFMERLLWFDDISNFEGLQIAFIGNRMYAALPSGLELRFGSDRKFINIESASEIVRSEFRLVFCLLAGMDALHACARAKPVEAIEQERTRYYIDKLAEIDRFIDKAISSGTIKSSPFPNYLTDDYHHVDQRLWGLLKPRF